MTGAPPDNRVKINQFYAHEPNYLLAEVLENCCKLYVLGENGKT